MTYQKTKTSNYLADRLRYETVTPLLRSVLAEVMANPVFRPFCLVGGTSLSLRLGHRKSIDIDLFSNESYGSLDFSVFDKFFQNNFDYCDFSKTSKTIGFGKSYFVGQSKDQNVKLDLYYKDEIIDPFEVIDNIRIASLNDDVALKIDVISRIGRKKDFWDLHELLDIYSLNEMLELHKQRYEYTHERNQIIENFINFDAADEDIDPICFKGKYWELIKLDFVELIENFQR